MWLLGMEPLKGESPLFSNHFFFLHKKKSWGFFFYHRHRNSKKILKNPTRCKIVCSFVSRCQNGLLVTTNRRYLGLKIQFEIFWSGFEKNLFWRVWVRFDTLGTSKTPEMNRSRQAIVAGRKPHQKILPEKSFRALSDPIKLA